MNRVVFAALPVAALALFLYACQPGSSSERAFVSGTTDTPHVAASSAVEAGRYMIVVGNCNDCHTENFMEADGDVAEADWLTGSVIGWRGPWGTTYPPNLRLTAADMTEDEFVSMLRTRKGLPPMPWMNVNQMTEQDARAVYQYLRALGPKGEKAPAALPPGVEPETPYLSLEPQHLERMETYLAKVRANPPVTTRG